MFIKYNDKIVNAAQAKVIVIGKISKFDTAKEKFCEAFCIKCLFGSGSCEPIGAYSSKANAEYVLEALFNMLETRNCFELPDDKTICEIRGCESTCI